MRHLAVALLSLVLLAAPLAVEAQPAGKIPRIGYLRVDSASQGPHWFTQDLREHGYVEGQNIVIERRYAEGRPERLPTLAAELVQLKVDVIVAFSNHETLAAKQATASIPIVMVFGVRPVEAGLVTSLARPGGNVTGTTVAPVAAGKYLELLKEAVPKLARVAILWDPTVLGHTAPARLEADARTLGLTLAFIEAKRPDDVVPAFERIIQDQPGALLVALGGALLGRMREIVEFAAQHRLPTIFPGARAAVDAGGLMSYGYDFPPLLRRAAWYIDRILRGAKPADLPVEQPTKVELVINLKSAKALGLTIPPSMLARADEVIQ